MMEDDRAAVLKLEARRIEAVNRGDADAIATMLSDDLIQVHATGRVDDRASALELERTIRRTIEPRVPTVRLYGDMAILTGPALYHHTDANGIEVVSKTFMTQVAVKFGGDWRFVSAQVTLVPGEPN